jgi:hypothetical protein
LKEVEMQTIGFIEPVNEQPGVQLVPEPVLDIAALAEKFFRIGFNAGIAYFQNVQEGIAAAAAA